MFSKFQNKRFFLNAVLVLLLTFLIASCSTSEPAPVDDAGSGDQDSGEDTADQPEAPAFVGNLRIATDTPVNTDPALISSDTEVLIANAVFDYLVDIDPQSNVVPRLATSWDVSEDGLTYTFQLAEDVKFHDGSDFSAEDVAWTFNRLRDEANEYATSSLYSNVISVAATGDLEVTFTLESTNPFFLFDLSDNHALVIKNGVTDASDFNGTGPFKVENYSPEERLDLVANEDYFIDGMPKLASIEIIFFADQNAMVEAMRGGQVDLVMRMTTSLFQSLQAEPGILTYDIPTNGFDVIRLRSDREPGNDPRIMQAMRLATDRAAILEFVHQGYGAIGNDSPIGPLYEAFHDASVQPPARDVEAAKALLAEAGYPDGISLVMHTPDSGGRPDLAVVLKEQWAEAGINIEISVEPENIYYGEDGWLEVDLGITGWGSRPYPQFYLDVMLISGAKWNESHFENAEFDALAATTSSTLDAAERIEAFRQIQELLADRGPIIIPYYFAQFGAIRDTFEGFELKAFAGRTDLRTIGLAE